MDNKSFLIFLEHTLPVSEKTVAPPCSLRAIFFCSVACGLSHSMVVVDRMDVGDRLEKVTLPTWIGD